MARDGLAERIRGPKAIPARRLLRRFLNMRVLIIDDERSIRTSTMVAIQAAGHQAETADSGQVAVLKLEEDAYDLSISRFAPWR